MNIRFSAVFAVSLLAGALISSGIPAQAQDTPATQAKSATPDQQDKRINGKWHFVFDTQGGDREFEAEFTVDADGKVSGTWDKTAASGTYKDGHLEMAFETTSQEAGETAKLQLDGKIDDTSTITGHWIFSSYEGDFKATHPKP